MQEKDPNTYYEFVIPKFGEGCTINQNNDEVIGNNDLECGKFSTAIDAIKSAITLIDYYAMFLTNNYPYPIKIIERKKGRNISKIYTYLIDEYGNIIKET